MKKVVLILSLILVGLVGNSQESKFGSSAYVAVSTPMLSTGYGGQIGYNPSYKLTNYVYLEGQVAFLYHRITSAFLSGEKRNAYQGSMLAGLKLYFNGEDKKNRFYSNILLGGGYYVLNRKDDRVINGWVPALSLGFYSELKSNVMLGIAAETPGNLLFKVGYHF